jgi:hypothetical protein
VGEAAPEARILFVLRGGHADVVGHGDHQAAVGAGDGHGHQAVAGDVHPDMLHGAEGPCAGHRGAQRDFHRDLLVDRPFGVQVRIARQRFDDLGGRRAGVGGGNAHTGFPDGTGDGFVTGKEEAGSGGGWRLRHYCGHDVLSGKGKNRPATGRTLAQVIVKRMRLNYPDLHPLRP